jgi:hypothetical protein
MVRGNAGRGGSTDGKKVNSATRPKTHGSSIYERDFKPLPYIRSLTGRIGADRVGFTGTS